MDSCNNISKAPFDPGWNDPPTFSYNAQQTTSSKPRNFLNKRVAFPLSGTTISSHAAPVNMPPMQPPVPVQPLVPLVNSTISIVETPQTIDSETALKEVKEILLKLLEESSELEQKASDIKRRIGVMEDMWVSGKLNTRIHLHMRDLAYALRDEQPTKADDIHRALMVDHVSAVSTWMPGVKLLIRSCIAHVELLAIDKE